MLFQISLLKKDAKQQVAILLTATDISQARDVLTNLRLITLSLNLFHGTPEEFGSNTLQVASSDYQGTLTLNAPTAENAVELALELGFDVINIIQNKEQLTAEQCQQLIQSVKTRIMDKIKEEQAQEAMEQQAQEKLYDDTQIKKVQEIISTTLTDINDLITKTQSYVSTINIKKLKEYEEELKKVKMGKNVNKMTEVLEEVFKTMEAIDLEYLDFQKKDETLVIKESLVSNLDVVGEYDKFVTAQKAQDAGIANTEDNKYYVFMGSLGMYVKFLRKDFGSKLQSIPPILHKRYEWIELLSLIILIELIIYLTYNKLLAISLSNERQFFTRFLNIWIAWILLYILKSIKSNNTIILILLFPVAIIVRFMLKNFIANNIL